MKKKSTFSAAFTLIELLVVITIIGILAGIALPVFNSVQIKGSQTKALAQAKQIGLALKLFAADNDGVYPKNGVPSTLGADPSTSNDAFAPLFPSYTQSEKIFGNKLSAYQTKTPDDVIDTTYTGSPQKTLQSGENVYGYMLNLTDASNPASPIVFDAPMSTAGVYSASPSAKGGVWSGTKAIIIRLDNSGAVENVNTQLLYVETTNNQGAKVNILDPAANTNLTGCKLLLPK